MYIVKTLINPLFYRFLSPFVWIVGGTDRVTMNLGGSCPPPVPSAICAPVYSSDIIILLETWSRLDSKSYTPPNYRELRIPSIKQPNVKNGRDSGGIIVWFKEHLWQYIQPVKKGTTHIWIKLKKEILCLDEDLYLCASYIPPRESPYYNEDIFSTLQSEIIYFQSLDPVLLMGDLNTRTGREAD